MTDLPLRFRQDRVDDNEKWVKKIVKKEWEDIEEKNSRLRYVDGVKGVPQRMEVQLIQDHTKPRVDERCQSIGVYIF